MFQVLSCFFQAVFQKDFQLNLLGWILPRPSSKTWSQRLLFFFIKAQELIKQEVCTHVAEYWLTNRENSQGSEVGFQPNWRHAMVCRQAWFKWKRLQSFSSFIEKKHNNFPPSTRPSPKLYNYRARCTHWHAEDGSTLIWILCPCSSSQFQPRFAPWFPTWMVCGVSSV